MKDISNLSCFEYLIYSDHYRKLYSDRNFREYYMKHPEVFQNVNTRKLPEMIMDKLPEGNNSYIPNVLFAFYDASDYGTHDDLVKFMLSLNKIELEDFIKLMCNYDIDHALTIFFQLFDKYLNVPLIYMFAHYITHAKTINYTEARKCIRKYECVSRLKTISNTPVLDINVGIIADFLKIPDERCNWDSYMSAWIPC